MIDQDFELRRLAELLGEARYGEIETRAATLLGLFPACGLAWKLLGSARLIAGTDALATLHQATVLLADDGEAHYLFGVALQQVAQFDHALASFDRALDIFPGDVESLRQRAAILIRLGRLAEAAHDYRTLLALRPDDAGAYLDLGNLEKLLGQPDEAMANYRRALELNRAFADAHYNLAIVQHESGQHQAAVAGHRRAIELAPDHAPAHLNLGNALISLGQLEQAAASYRAALRIRPDFAEADLDLGNALKELGCIDDAVECYRRAIDVDPDFDVAHDNLLFTQNLIPDHDPRTMLADARRFGDCVARRAQPGSDWPNTPIAGRRLRVGLVSGDFRDHPVSHFLDGVLGALNAGGGVELFAYANCRQDDAMSARIRAHCHAWRAIVGLSDERVAGQIRDDAIDILVDLAGHSEHNRLALFAWRPAPVQVSWLGYHATTGVAAIDHIVADRWTVPASEEPWFTENVWRLPETLWCLTPPPFAIEVSALPALAAGHVTFACFNRLDKVGDAVVALWSRVLQAVPRSRLLLKARALAHDEARRRIAERFAAHGIVGDRLILEGPSSRADYLAAYQRVDIALDPFPYAGATTSVEALWMGVPLITLAGERFMSRQGVSLLMNAGLPDWIAVDHDDYVERAVTKASDLPALAALRASLRTRVQASPLFDAPRFAAHFEAALRSMWQARGN